MQMTPTFQAVKKLGQSYKKRNISMPLICFKKVKCFLITLGLQFSKGMVFLSVFHIRVTPCILRFFH